ncbi:MAG TPA: hypothetical protein VMW15_12010 [Terracidiphilus sp.]|jgi:hypothetical protein|nr:hypothetical protein [Terracidiphilus sp.]
MKLPAKIAALALPFLLAGCGHWPHKQTLPPPPPSLAPSKVPPPIVFSPPLLTIPDQEQVNYTDLPEETPKPPVRRRRAPTSSSGDLQPSPSGEPEVSAIGQLSSGDPTDSRRQTQASIDSIERSLDEIKPRLSGSEQKTAAHIREFLKQAKDALASGDIDGAGTLAAKARVLLNELLR